jgi:tetratricopeptide (TPR) repeat protein
MPAQPGAGSAHLRGGGLVPWMPKPPCIPAARDPVDQHAESSSYFQQVIRSQLAADKYRERAVAALRLITTAFPTDYANPDVWPVYARLLPHALAVSEHAEALAVEPEATAWLLNEAGQYLGQRADHQQARGLLERAVAIREAILGVDHPATATSLHNLADVLYAQGNLDGARTLHERALAIHEASLGPDDRVTAHSLRASPTSCATKVTCVPMQAIGACVGHRRDAPRSRSPGHRQ